jgi:diacylglycerol kinase (ATP)
VDERPTLRCTVIENPAAGQWTQALAAQVAGCCERHGAEVLVARTQGRRDAARLAGDAVRTGGPHRAGDPYHVILAVGGDGTVQEVASGMMAAGARADRHALFVVPAGTGNSGYRAYWGDRPWQQALIEALAAPRDRVRPLDLARVAEHDELVVLGAGAGLAAEVLVGARDVTLTGPARLQAGLDRAIATYVPYPGRLVVDGAVVHQGLTIFAAVGGGRHRAWQYQVLPHSVLDDGLLDVCVLDSTVPLADLPGRLREGSHVGASGVVYARGRRIVIERTDGRALSFEHDGELIPGTGWRVTVDVLPGALPVLCAPAAAPPLAGPQTAGLAAR